ncbi:hypothetical protein FQR65_LT09432 [Abscondita terminalis]|nr:hypothetical protein FQR65_LT09432 [Abscondita terminalis]
MSEPIVSIKNGKLRGRIAKDYEDNEYFCFQGIPYAKPPLGTLRFKAPLPPESWTGVRDATQNGNDSLSVDQPDDGSEDCLFLNVYTRQLYSEHQSLKPVMFWIHGGGFVGGSGSSLIYGPQFLITRDVVIVTINYRLGLLGFLSFEDVSLEITGNAGLKDQVMALRWVQENIKHFGGDPNNVTAFGESAGAASIHYLILSPLAKGLFHKAILQSGCASCPWALGRKSHATLKHALKMNRASEKDVLAILQNMSVEDLRKLQRRMPDNFEAYFIRGMGPVIENSNSPDPIITQKPEEIILSGNYNHVPLIIGFNSREGMLADVLNREFRRHGHAIKDFENKVPHNMNVAKGSALSKSIADKIKSFYYGNETPTENNKNQYYLVHGDNQFVWPAINTARQHYLTSNEPIYVYRLSVESNLNICKNIAAIENPGVTHADDLPYVFKSVITPKIIPYSTEDISIKRVVLLWTNFAKTGNPNPEHQNSIINIPWKPIENKKLNYLDIGENLTVGAPLPPESWTGIRDATKNGNDCVANYSFFGYPASEDCLFLNVYTRELRTEDQSLKPVMVWIHGGAFKLDSGNSLMYGPQFLITKDVVIVTINYRIGLLGFLCLEDTSLEVPGNAGLKDQVMALRWVQKNIKQFCGDPNNVTLFGDSAGAASIHYLILSPLAKGLFHKAILQSGNALCLWAITKPTYHYIVNALNDHGKSEKEILTLLQNMPVGDLLKLQKKLPENLEANYIRGIAPVIENPKSPNCIISQKPEDIISSGNYNHVPIIIGFNSREGMLADIYNREFRKYGRAIQDFENKIPYNMNVTKGSHLSKTIAEKIKNFYYDIDTPSEENKNQYYLVHGDNMFVWPTISTATNHFSSTREPIYLYRFSVESTLNHRKVMAGIENPGVTHSDEIGYIFRHVTSPTIIPNSIEGISIRRMISLWTNFAKTGNPNPKEEDSLISVRWKPIEKKKLNYLEIGENLTVGVNPEGHRMQFWEDLYLLASGGSKL